MVSSCKVLLEYLEVKDSLEQKRTLLVRRLQVFPPGLPQAIVPDQQGPTQTSPCVLAKVFESILLLQAPVESTVFSGNLTGEKGIQKKALSPQHQVSGALLRLERASAYLLGIMLRLPRARSQPGWIWAQTTSSSLCLSKVTQFLHTLPEPLCSRCTSIVMMVAIYVNRKVTKVGTASSGQDSGRL